ncbi:MAG: ABC-type branched-chain amino acid transport system, substrate-binding protein [Nocardioides sp.]|nr:ABC-type branched-chain amino acid transport system, substrate-binding protein [Nocardioides sp.]
MPGRRRARPRSTRTARASVTAVTCLLAILLAACGSQLDPDTVATVNGSGTGAQTGDVPGTGTDPGGGTAPGTDPGGGTAPGGGTDPGGGTGPGAGNGGDPQGGGGPGDSPPPVSGPQGSCDGFKNGPGITDKTIVIGNASDISGPVPGLFEASQDAVRAFVAYFNASSDICGRKLAINNYDSRTDAAADQQAYTRGCDEVFAMVGSMSAFDSGGASTAQSCGLPDIRSAAVTVDRNKCTTCFGAQSTNTGEHQNAVADFVLDNYGDSGQHAGFLYINAGASAENAVRQANAMQKRGMHFDYVQGIDISEFNYSPYVQQLKDKNIEVVFWTGAYQQSVRLRQAMQQQGYKPKLYLRDPTDYTPEYVQSGGDAVDGTVIFTNFVPFEERDSSPELQLYLSWLNQVKPGATPGFFGVFSWSAARLFVERAVALGGKLNRATMIDALRKTDNWTSQGLTSPQHVGPKRTGDCWRFIELRGGEWRAINGTKYHCSGTTVG